jgi:hypothetical protein
MFRQRMSRLAFIAWVALSGAHGAAAAGQAVTGTRTIASVTTVDYRAVVVAGKLSGGAAPTARVTVAGYLRDSGHWRRVETRRLAGPFFWKTITAPHAICRLEVSTRRAQSTMRPVVIVQLLLSPSLGCGRAQRVALPRV